MKIVTKRGRFPAKTKRRLKFLATELKAQKQQLKAMEEAKNNRYYRVAEKVLQAIDWYYHDGLDISTVMSLIDDALRYPVEIFSHREETRENYDEDGLKVKLPRVDYDRVVVYTRHQLRPHDLYMANMLYMMDNAVGMWYDGYTSDKLAINLLEDFATVLMSVWSGRKEPLEYRAGR